MTQLAGMTRVVQVLFRQVPIAPLVVFRIVFGTLMFYGVLRFAYKGWIDELYIAPQHFFPFVDGVNPVPGNGMYWVFALMAISALCIALGLFFRISAPLFFFTFHLCRTSGQDLLS